MNEQCGFKVSTTQARVVPSRTAIRVGKRDVCEALRMYLISKGIYVPNGKMFVWGIENDNHSTDHDGLTLVIDELS